MTTRTIALIDMDCFYAQVEQRDDPSLQGLPCAVVQYNEWKGGAIIAVNYEARSMGVKRPMRGEEAKSLCPDIKLVKVPEARGKADLTKYRDAGAEVIEVLKEFSECVERASIDEAYVDLTNVVDKMISDGHEEVNPDQLPCCHVIGWESDENQNKEVKGKESVTDWLKNIYDHQDSYCDDARLAIGAKITAKMREAVVQKTGFKCSAGIAHNKMISKLCCGLNKPDKQTIVPHSSINHLYQRVSIGKVKGFGGKFGDEVAEKLGITMMSELSQVSESQLKLHFGDKSGMWLYDVGRGIEHEAVAARLLPKSVGCSKNFVGKNALKTKEKVRYWLNMLSMEMEERLIKDKQQNDRSAKHMTVGMTTLESNRRVAVTRLCPVNSYCSSRLLENAYQALLKVNKAPRNSDLWEPEVINLCVSAGKFEDNLGTNTGMIDKFFTSAPSESSSAGGMVNSYFGSINASNKSDDEAVKTSNKVIETVKGNDSSIKIPNGNRAASTIKDNSVKAMFEHLNRQKDQPCASAINVDEIDVDVLNQLPADIKNEIQGHIESLRENRTRNDTGNSSAEFIPSFETCKKCGQRIVSEDSVEHADYHVAKELYREMNISTVPTQRVDKRKNTKREASNKKVKLESKTIDKYFCKY